MKNLLSVLAFLVVLLSGSASFGASFSKGLTAYQSRDYATALREWKGWEAKNGGADVQFNIGTMYGNGFGVTQDYKQAFKWYRKAAKQGLVEAQFSLGLLYDNGDGVTQDYEQAMKWYRKAAKQGYANAENGLGSLYGKLQDYKQAVKWYRKAAEQGNARAQNNLGLMYMEGHGVTQDYATAHMWANISAANGSREAVVARDIIAKKMPPADILKAQKMAREWMRPREAETARKAEEELAAARAREAVKRKHQRKPLTFNERPRDAGKAVEDAAAGIKKLFK